MTMAEPAQSIQTVIHPSAIVHPRATIGRGVRIGPYCSVGEYVVLGDDVELVSHVAVSGRTEIGPRTRIFPFASIGFEPQDLKFRGEPSTLTVGSDCTVREHVTLSPGTVGGDMATRVGDHCLLMIGVHVGHDCQLGNHVILSNNAGLAGHCKVGDYVILSGHTGVTQFVQIGAHAFVGGMTKVENDVIPYGMAIGNPGHLAGLNLVGLRRRGFDREGIHKLRAAYRMIFSNEGTLQERVEDASKIFAGDDLVEQVIAFIQKPSGGALMLPRDGAEIPE
jgi:UDP-N-acetylglucosamine acyltransferase